MTRLKRNVLQLTNSFHQGGSERQMVELTRLLHESGRYRAHVAALDGGGSLREEVKRLGIDEIAEYPLTSFYDLNAVKQLRSLARLLREREIEIIHTYDLYTNIFGMAAAALARVPVRIASRRCLEGVYTPAQVRAELYAYGLAQAVIANSGAVREQLLKEGVRAEKVVTIHNGMNTSRVHPRPDLRREEALAMFNLPPGSERRFVTIIANLKYEVKDHRTFLRAAARVRAARPEAAFILAGEGGLTESLRALAAQLGLAQDVFFTGRCVRVSELLSISDVCVLSSKAEGFSNSIIEYMAAARPVVATDVGGAREAIREGETGYLVKPGDDETMAERIISLLADPERARRMGERGLQVVNENFSCEALFERTHELYQRLLAGARPESAQSVRSVRRSESV
jgi:glycosyltransferase involved in cell wall biosynthesis